MAPGASGLPGANGRIHPTVLGTKRVNLQTSGANGGGGVTRGQFGPAAAYKPATTTTTGLGFGGIQGRPAPVRTQVSPSPAPGSGGGNTNGHGSTTSSNGSGSNTPKSAGGSTTTVLGLTTAVGTAATMALAERRASNGTSPAPPMIPEDRVLLYDESLPYVECVEGPIMFTAPHGLELFRGGAFGERTRVHYRERWVSEITLKLSQSVAKKLYKVMGSTSYIVWNCATAKKQDASNLDPNYLIEADFSNSAWHRTLRKWRGVFEDTGIPLLHIDIHGKLDRKDNLDIDVGTGALEELWTGRDIVKTLKNTISDELEKALENRRSYGYKQLKMGVERQPQLRGYNDRGFHTMAHQSVLLGIPAVQLELPKTIRKALIVEGSFFDRFAEAIANTYARVFMPSPKLAMDRIPAHYPNTFRRHLEQRLQDEAEAAAKAKERRRSNRHGGFVPPQVLPPQPAKPTRSAALARQLLQDLAYHEATNEDKQI